ncbi:MAG TPA: phosphoribosyltransferase family protein, partial [bacterium]
QQAIRNFSVKVKFNPVGGVLAGKKVVLVDDSIVRGTTLKILTQIVRKAGAKEVHIRVTSPRICYPCYYGMDFPTPKELIASNKSVDEIRAFLGADSLGYLSKEGMLSTVPGQGRGYCTACFDGEYPDPPEERFEKNQYET